MNSSISDSEPRSWRRLLALYAASVAALGIAAAALLLGADPYGTGRLAWRAERAVPDFGPRFSAVYLGRQSRFDTAIIGNSTIQLVDPARVSAASGKRVVSLTVPGSGPLEQLAIAEWFLTHHPADAIGGFVFGIDGTWCEADGELRLSNPFPFWLYSASVADYAVNMMSLRSLGAVTKEAKLSLRPSPPRPHRTDGYNDYEADRVWNADAVHRLLAGFEQGFAAEAIVAGDDGTVTAFAAFPRLGDFLRRLPARVPVVLVLPPRFRAALPKTGRAAAVELACQGEVVALAEGRPFTHLIDFLQRPEIMDDEANFWDDIHYRAPVARMIEAEIAAAFRDSP